MKSLLFLFLFLSAIGFTDDEDSKTTIIQSIDLVGGEGPTAPNYSLLILDLQKLKAPSANGHLIFRQLRNRVLKASRGETLLEGKKQDCSATKGKPQF